VTRAGGHFTNVFSCRLVLLAARPEPLRGKPTPVTPCWQLKTMRLNISYLVRYVPHALLVKCITPNHLIIIFSVSTDYRYHLYRFLIIYISYTSYICRATLGGNFFYKRSESILYLSLYIPLTLRL